MIDDTPSPARAGRRRRFPRRPRRRQRFDPELPGIEAAGEVAQQVKRLGQNVVARHRFELGNVERGENFAQFEHAGAAGFAAGAGWSDHGIAGIKQHCPTLFHIRVDAFECLLGGPRRTGHDRPMISG